MEKCTQLEFYKRLKNLIIGDMGLSQLNRSGRVPGMKNESGENVLHMHAKSENCETPAGIASQVRPCSPKSEAKRLTDRLRKASRISAQENGRKIS